jgi:CMP-N,N'-diacetyllegionaminic acid synthase
MTLQKQMKSTMRTSNKNSKTLAIIPARGGSKRLKNKNILKLNNKPLIAYSIEAALASKYIDEVVVTSDNETILEIATSYGTKTIKRPNELATDSSATIDTILHTLEIYNSFDTIIVLQPTSPLRTSNHIDEAIEEFINKKANGVISVCKTEHSPLWSNTLEKNNKMDNFLSKELLNLRSQDLPEYFRLNGAIYIAKKDKIIEQKTFFIDSNIYAYIMPQEVSIDIDTHLDFLVCETVLKYQLENAKIVIDK